MRSSSSDPAPPVARRPTSPGVGRRNLAVGLALVALALAVGVASTTLPLGTAREPGPGLAPLVLATLLALLGALVAAGRERTPADWAGTGRAVALLGACAFAAVALERLGYRVTIFLMVAWLAGAVERAHPAAALALAAGLALGTHYVFGTLLLVPLPRGPFGL